MGIIVQKFGGTSLRNLSKQSNILKHIKNEATKGNKLVVVVSAMGRSGEPYATDTLIKQLENISTKINPKKKDLMMSVGETISAALVSHLLESQGIPAEALTGFQAGIITDDNFNSSKIIGINTKKILKHLNKNKVVVVAGFQGITEELDITTLGRGGSDTTAVALGGHLKAERVDIFTDVPGIAFTDPKLVSNVEYIEKISYDEVYKLAINGAKVIHPNAVALGKEFNVPLRILSTFEDSPGTYISNEKSNLEVLGIVIKKHDDNSKLSIIFNDEYESSKVGNLKDYLNEEKYNLKYIEYHDDNITFYVNNDKLSEFVQNLCIFLNK